MRLGVVAGAEHQHILRAGGGAEGRIAHVRPPDRVDGMGRPDQAQRRGEAKPRTFQRFGRHGL
jgi:hypothetical protein